MSNRREFLKQSAAASVTAIASVPVFSTATDTAASTMPAKRWARLGATALRIKSVIRREDTTRRLGGSGDDFHMSWAADDRQFVSVNDGYGWFSNPKGNYNNRLWTIAGGPEDAVFKDVPGYPDLMNVINNVAEEGRYYGYGTLALDGYIYHFLATGDHPATYHEDIALPEGIWNWVGSKLIYSPDNGRTWCNQDGSMPVVWEPWQSRSRENMVFFREPKNAFSQVSVLQMGRNYEFNQDGYVYIYSENRQVGPEQQLIMFRVPKSQILNRSAYEYFAGLRPDGNATWSQDIESRAVVHTGWPGDVPSVTYNAPLGLYMMANGGGRYLGFYVASKPWGPWTQIHEEPAWTPRFNDPAINDPAGTGVYQPQIAPKWIAPDGKSFWLVWSQYPGWPGKKKELQQAQRELVTKFKHISDEAEGARIGLEWYKRYAPYYSFNVQRVDLVIT